jgi:hypothetical protein
LALRKGAIAYVDEYSLDSESVRCDEDDRSATEGHCTSVRVGATGSPNRIAGACGQIPNCSPRHHRARDGIDMRLRVRTLSIGSFAKSPLLVLQAHDTQNLFLAFDIFEPHSLTRTVPALNSEGTQLRYAVDVSPSVRVYQPESRSQAYTTLQHPVRMKYL